MVTLASEFKQRLVKTEIIVLIIIIIKTTSFASSCKGQGVPAGPGRPRACPEGPPRRALPASSLTTREQQPLGGGQTGARTPTGNFHRKGWRGPAQATIFSENALSSEGPYFFMYFHPGLEADYRNTYQGKGINKWLQESQ